jgi:hypothetical protein
MSEEAELKKKFEKETKWRLENPVKAIQEVLDGEIHATRSTYFEERVRWLEQQLEEEKEKNRALTQSKNEFAKDAIRFSNRVGELETNKTALEKQVEELNRTLDKKERTIARWIEEYDIPEPKF